MVQRYMALRGSRQDSLAAQRPVTRSRGVLATFTPRQRRLVAQFRRKDLPRWLCDFLNLDLQRANEAALKLLGFELACFCDDEPERLYLPPDYERQRLSSGGRLRGSDPRRPWPYAPEMVRALHSRLRAALVRLWTVDGCLEPFEGIHGLRRRPDGSLELITFAGRDGTFLAKAWQLIAACGSRFRRCKREGCGQYFAAGDLRQVFCTDRYANAVRVARFRARNPGALADRKRRERRRRDERLGHAIKPPRRCGRSKRMRERGER
jgi:hypothetical protein